MPNIFTSSFYPSTIPANLTVGGKVDFEELKAFTEAASIDFVALSNILNTQVLNIIGSLPYYPGENINAAEFGLDGKNLFVDTGSTSAKDYGLLWNESSARPKTVYETVLFLMQILANVENGLKETVSIGSITSPIEISGVISENTIEYDWPYNDGMYEYLLYKYDSITGKISKIEPGSNISVEVDYSTKKVIITNDSGITVSIYGYIWHPVFV